MSFSQYFLAAIILLSNSSIASQIRINPKVGLAFQGQVPTLEQFGFSSDQSYLFELEGRSNYRKSFFNPGIFVIFNKLSLIDSLLQRQRILFDNELWLALRIAYSARVIDLSAGGINVRGGLLPELLLVRPDFSSLAINDNYRSASISFLIGLDVEVERVILDVDYNIGFVRKIRDADIVSNRLLISLGYRF